MSEDKRDGQYKMKRFLEALHASDNSKNDLEENLMYKSLLASWKHVMNYDGPTISIDLTKSRDKE